MVSELGKKTMTKNTRDREVLDKIWKMSQALYNNSILGNDVAMSNYKALTKINKFCAEELHKLDK